MSYASTTIRDDLPLDIESIDWSFPNLSNSGLHSVHWYPATYLSAIPGTLIPALSKSEGVVLDPFCGSGTSGLEAIRLGRNFIGIDNNPVAMLITEAKLKFATPKRLVGYLGGIIDASQGLLGNGDAPDHPNREELLDWYHPQTVDVLTNILNSILLVDDRLIRRTLLSVFSSILKNCSSQGRHWGWVCDNVKPRPLEITYKDAGLAFSSAVNEFARASDVFFQASCVHSPGLTREVIRSRSKLMRGDSIEKMKGLSPASVDMIVTSPPYYGVADYVKSQRLSYLWFDRSELVHDKLGFRDFEDLRSQEAGARSNRHRKNSHDLYMKFMENFFGACSRVLKKGGFMALVVGESPSRTGTIDALIDAALGEGFHLRTRLGRDIRSNRRRLMAKVKGEEVLVFSR